MTALGLGLVVATAVITGVVVANWSGRDVERKAETASGTPRSAATHKAHPAEPVPAAQPHPLRPRPRSLGATSRRRPSRVSGATRRRS